MRKCSCSLGHQRKTRLVTVMVASSGLLRITDIKVVTANHTFFTVYLEYEHLITPAYLPRLDNGKYIDNQNNPIAKGTYQGCTGFGSLMQDQAILSAAQLGQHPLIGFLGSTENPHVHIQAAYSDGSWGYLKNNFFDPGVILAGHP